MGIKSGMDWLDGKNSGAAAAADARYGFDAPERRA